MFDTHILGPNQLNLTSTSQTNTSITLVWNSGGFSVFRIEYEGETREVRDRTTYTLTGLLPDTFYPVTLTATNGTESAQSETVAKTAEGGEEYVVTLV